jgi:hypothetical protein
MGGFQHPWDWPVSEENYWVTDEEWDFTDWMPGEPNDLIQDEHLLDIHGEMIPKWNDNYWKDQAAFVIEYDVEFSTGFSDGFDYGDCLIWASEI